MEYSFKFLKTVVDIDLGKEKRRYIIWAN